MISIYHDREGATDHYKQLLWELTKTELKVRYAGSILGFIWVFLKPFATFAIILAVFSVFFGQHDTNYSLNLLIGLILFFYFSEGTINLTDALLKRSHIILRLNFPRIIILLSSLASSLINLFASLVFFFILVVLFFDQQLSITISGLMGFLFIVGVLTLIILSFGLIASIIQVFFRDFQQIWSLALQLLFYATPILYPITILSDTLRKIIMMNPLTIIIDTARNQLLGSPLNVSMNSVLVLIICAVFFMLIALSFFNKRIQTIPENL